MYLSSCFILIKGFESHKFENNAPSMKVKIRSEKYLETNFKRCFSQNPAVLFSLSQCPIWWSLYKLFPMYML